jgi:predicted small lipoprotein YifL
MVPLIGCGKKGPLYLPNSAATEPTLLPTAVASERSAADSVKVAR